MHLKIMSLVFKKFQGVTALPVLDFLISNIIPCAEFISCEKSLSSKSMLDETLCPKQATESVLTDYQSRHINYALHLVNGSESVYYFICRT